MFNVSKQGQTVHKTVRENQADKHTHLKMSGIIFKEFDKYKRNKSSIYTVQNTSLVQI